MMSLGKKLRDRFFHSGWQLDHHARSTCATGSPFRCHMDKLGGQYQMDKKEAWDVNEPLLALCGWKKSGITRHLLGHDSAQDNDK